MEIIWNDANSHSELLYLQCWFFCFFYQNSCVTIITDLVIETSSTKYVTSIKPVIVGDYLCLSCECRVALLSLDVPSSTFHRCHVSLSFWRLRELLRKTINHQSWRVPTYASDKINAPDRLKKQYLPTWYAQAMRKSRNCCRIKKLNYNIYL
jgi:hypothetical protein